MVKPLPSISSIYFHKNCMTKTKVATKYDKIEGPIKLVDMSLSIFFKRCHLIIMNGKNIAFNVHLYKNQCATSKFMLLLRSSLHHFQSESSQNDDNRHHQYPKPPFIFEKWRTLWDNI